MLSDFSRVVRLSEGAVGFTNRFAGILLKQIL